MDSLLSELLSGAQGGAHSGVRGGHGARKKGEVQGGVRLHRDSKVRPGVSFVQATESPPPPIDSGKSTVWQEVRRHGASPRSIMDRSVPLKPQLKRRRSPEVAHCPRCFRTGHLADECRHLIVCLNCQGAGHVAANCPSPSKEPSRRRHVKAPAPSRHPSSRAEPGRISSPIPSQASKVQISLPLTLDIIKAKQDLQNTLVIYVISGALTVDDLLEALMNATGLKAVGSLMPFRGKSYLLSCDNTESANLILKFKDFHFQSMRNTCRISVAPWSPEIGSFGRASGIREWIHIWNLPLHCWGWSSVQNLTKSFGDLVTVRRHSSSPSVALSALIRLRSNSVFPIEVDLSIGMRRFAILVTSSKSPSPVFDPQSDCFSLTLSSNPPVFNDARVQHHPSAPVRFTHNVPADLKGKSAKKTLWKPVIQLPGEDSSSGEDLTVGAPSSALLKDPSPPAPAAILVNIPSGISGEDKPKEMDTRREFHQGQAIPSPLLLRRPVGQPDQKMLDGKNGNQVDCGQPILSHSCSAETVNPFNVNPVDLINTQTSSLGSDQSIGFNPIAQSQLITNDATQLGIQSQIAFVPNIVGVPFKGHAPIIDSDPSLKDNPKLDLSKVVIPPIISTVGLTQLQNDIPISSGISLADSFRDASKPPSWIPIPAGFKWHFILGIWSMIPIENSDLIDSYLQEPDLNQEEFVDSENLLHPEESNKLPDSPASDSSDSGPDLAERARLIFEGKGVPSSPASLLQGNRRSSRQKKPPARWTEDSNLASRPPRSSKKAAPPDCLPEGKRQKLEPVVATVRRSIQFSEVSSQDGSRDPDSQVPEQTAG